MTTYMNPKGECKGKEWEKEKEKERKVLAGKGQE